MSVTHLDLLPPLSRHFHARRFAYQCIGHACSGDLSRRSRFSWRPLQSHLAFRTTTGSAQRPP